MLYLRDGDVPLGTRIYSDINQGLFFLLLPTPHKNGEMPFNSVGFGR